MEMMSTVNDILKIEMMKMCSCGREKAVYFCKFKECPNNQSQPYYCMLCSDDEENKHMHKESRINKEIQIQQAKWMSAKDEIESLLRKASHILEYHSSLITLSERLMIGAPRANPLPFRSLTQDFEKLKNLNRQIQQHFSQTILPLCVDCKLLELIAQVNNLLSFEKAGKPLAYLASANEQTIWDYYQPAIE